MALNVTEHDEGSLDPHTVSTVHSFPVNTFIENIAIRKLGELLVTVHNTNDLILVDPKDKGAARTIHHFEQGVSGIVEQGEDQFYVSSGTLGQTGRDGTVKCSKLLDVPDAIFLNGSCVSPRQDIILAVDSLFGSIYEIDVKQAKVKSWLQNKAFEKAADNPVLPGINGIKLHPNDKGSLYCSNTDARTILRVGVTSDGDATRDIETVASNLNADDFAFSTDGGALYLTTHIHQSVVKLELASGRRSRFAGGPEDAVVAGTTAAAFGRLIEDNDILYVTTTGGMSLPVDGKIGPGRVLGIKI